MLKIPAGMVYSFTDEMVARADALGLDLTMYPESVAGHGLTGRATWELTVRNEHRGRMRYGSTSSPRAVHTQVIQAIKELEAISGNRWAYESVADYYLTKEREAIAAAAE